jgi:predicted site-specific integrase-resolvase
MNQVLIGWKEISQYLRVSEKTAMRYQKERDLPVEKDPAGHPIIKKNTADEWRLRE